MFPTAQFWKGKKVFLTGHLGFKGGWMSVILQSLGAHVSGYSLKPPYSPYLGKVLDIPNICHHSFEGDINDYEKLEKSIETVGPDFVVHMAAQPLVIESYKTPLNTTLTNVLGTANLLEACKSKKSIKNILVITTDKCYQNMGTKTAYRETCPLGGNDIYSASKACAELITHAYRQSFFSNNEAPLVSTARAGNVIGGGDWSHNRLIPDLVRNQYEKKEFHVRSPHAIRPWQHVIEPIVGYLMLIQSMSKSTPGAFNFGPSKKQIATVEDIVALFLKCKQNLSTEVAQYHEEEVLLLDSQKSWELLKWKSVFSLEDAVNLTAEWYELFYTKVSPNRLIDHMMKSYDLAEQKLMKEQR